MHPPRLFAVFLLPALACAAMAQERSATPSLYVQGGWATESTNALTLGATLPWGHWQAPLAGGALTGHWDAYLSRWDYDGVGHGSLLLLGVTPTLRWTPDDGHAAWFVEAGVGATLADHLYRTQQGKDFSTAFNFASHIGVGLRWGAGGRHELLLRVQHVSNAGIKEPNPGQNFVQLRYAVHL